MYTDRYGSERILCCRAHDYYYILFLAFFSLLSFAVTFCCCLLPLQLFYYSHKYRYRRRRRRFVCNFFLFVSRMPFGCLSSSPPSFSPGRASSPFHSNFYYKFVFIMQRLVQHTVRVLLLFIHLNMISHLVLNEREKLFTLSRSFGSSLYLTCFKSFACVYVSPLFSHFAVLFLVI